MVSDIQINRRIPTLALRRKGLIDAWSAGLQSIEVKKPLHHRPLPRSEGSQGPISTQLHLCANQMQRTNTPQFVMLQLTDLEKAVELLGSRSLQLRDAAVMLALMAHTDTYSGRIRVTTQRLAQELSIQEADTRASIARLKRQHLLRQVKDSSTGDRYYRLNPWMVRSSSKGGLLGLAMKEFSDA